MLIRRSVVEHRRVFVDRVPKVLCVKVRPSEREGEVDEMGEKELALVVSVRCGKE